MKICFFVNLEKHSDWKEVISKVGFYRDDIKILTGLGHEVVVAPRVRDVDLSADLFFCWWWGYSIAPVLAGRLIGRPVIVTGAFDFSSCRQELPGICFLDRPWWKKAIIKTVLALSDASAFVSAHEYSEVCSNLYVRSPRLLCHSVDTAVYYPRSGSERGRYFFCITWTSRENIVRKGLINSIRAFKLALEKLKPDVKFYIAGKIGDGHADVLELINSLGLTSRVKYLGMISEEEKLLALRECIAYVQPSLYEGFGVAIAEAISCGSSVISSAVGAVPEVTGGLCSYVNPRSVDEIAEQMIIAQDTIVSDQIKRKRHEWMCLNYSVDRRADKIREIISEIS
jgi:glycosyltransferase involved in cell wall biosynthesis